jgi:hypothetical protein
MYAWAGSWPMNYWKQSKSFLVLFFKKERLPYATFALS